MKDRQACIEQAARYIGESETMLRHGNYAEAQAAATLATSYAALATVVDDFDTAVKEDNRG